MLDLANNFIIRDISASDIDAVSFVNVSSYLEADKRSGIIQSNYNIDAHLPYNRQRWSDDFNEMLCRDNSEERFRGIFNDSSMIGFVWYGVSGANLDDAEIYSIYVHPDFWGEGVGRVLLSDAKGKLHDSGFTNMVVTTDKNDPLPNAFYKKYGGVLLLETMQVAESGLELVSYEFEI